MTKHKLLQAALAAFGLIFCLIYLLAISWPSGWAWHDGPPAANHYFMMIVGIYAVLGVFLMRAALNPEANKSLISFTIWSSVVHGAIMAAQVGAMPEMHGHFYGDIAALFLCAIVLGYLTLEKKAETPAD